MEVSLSIGLLCCPICHDGCVFLANLSTLEAKDEEEATMRVGAVGMGNTMVICVALVVKSGWSGWGCPWMRAVTCLPELLCVFTFLHSPGARRTRHPGVTSLWGERSPQGAILLELLSDLDAAAISCLFPSPAGHGGWGRGPKFAAQFVKVLIVLRATCEENMYAGIYGGMRG